MKTLWRYFCACLLWALIRAPASATEPDVAGCIGSSQPAVCVAMKERALRAKALANGDRKQWASVAFALIENAPGSFVYLPNGNVLNLYSAEQRRTSISAGATREERIASNRIVAQWALYLEIVLAHHKRGILTYDIYPCIDVCEAHRRGFEWAEKNSVREYHDCGGESRSFIEGCAVWVTRKKGFVLPEGQ